MTEGMDEEIATTMDGKHEMLQGIKKVTIDSSGSAVFSKLKIMEVSSKHKHQVCSFFLFNFSF